MFKDYGQLKLFKHVAPENEEDVKLVCTFFRNIGDGTGLYYSYVVLKIKNEGVKTKKRGRLESSSFFCFHSNHKLLLVQIPTLLLIFLDRSK